MKALANTDTFKGWMDKINADIYNNPILHSFDYDLANTTGTSFALIGGNYRDGNTPVFIADGSVTLTANSDNWVVMNGDTQALENYDVEGNIPAGTKVVRLYKVTLDEFETITAIVDYRAWLTVS